MAMRFSCWVVNCDDHSLSYISRSRAAMTRCCTENLCVYYCLSLPENAVRVTFFWYRNKVSQHVIGVAVLVTLLPIIASTSFGHLESMPVMDILNNYEAHSLLNLLSLTLHRLIIVSLH